MGCYEWSVSNPRRNGSRAHRLRRRSPVPADEPAGAQLLAGRRRAREAGPARCALVRIADNAEVVSMQVTRERQRTRRASSAAGRVRLRMEAPHATPGERTSMGDAARAEVPHELQGVWEPGS